MHLNAHDRVSRNQMTGQLLCL